MPDGRLLQDWLNSIGKERLQEYQDTFARTFGISLCLVDLNGKAATVWSNSAMHCHFMMKNYRSRCITERNNIMEYVIKNRKSKLVSCYMGVTFFMCPIVFENNLMGFLHGGGVVTEQGKERNPALQKTHNLPMVTEKYMCNCIALLSATLELLRPNEYKIQEELSTNIEETPYWFDEKLSRREREIARLVCIGKTNKEIALELFISEKTVKTHVSNILGKLAIKDRMQLALSCQES